MDKNNKIHIIDVTNRDGVQTANLGLAKLQKTMINVYLDEMGIFQSEFGFPVTNHETNYLNANLELAELGVIKNLRLSGWTRAVVKDIVEAQKRVPKLKYINLSMSTSDQMIKNKFKGKIDRKEVLSNTADAVKYAKDHGFLIVGINAEDASRTNREFLLEFALKAKESGATRFRYCDTLGYDDPFTIYDNISYIAKHIKMDIELHCHNDLGMVVANSVMGAKAAIDNGVNAFINTTVNGLGERAGNADLVSVILALKKSSGFANNSKYMLDEKIDLSKAWKIAKYASYAFGVHIPINQPGVGSNAFAHESGIHADGALKDRRNYELYDYEELGRGEPDIIETGRMISTGEYGGIKGFRNVYGELEVNFECDEHAHRILELVRYANVHTQKPLINDELLFIAKYPEQARKILTVSPDALIPKDI
ncbi:MAG: homocitrate synthase [Elusimicrobiota bacterium]|nr:homocitrate synthase [Elusimicrobiota bacterium]